MDQPSPAPVDALIIDIVSDVVCPWCYVGKRRLEAALAQRPDVTARVRWHPFQLDPAIPAGGLDRQDYMVGKFGDPGRIAQIHERLTEAGRNEGLPFAFDRIRRAVNTLDAHRVMHWAGEAGLQDAAAEALFRGYFVEGRDLGDQAVLADIAAAIGLDRDRVAADLAGERDRATVEAQIAQATRIGVSGVPFFIFAQAFAVSGAQASEILATAIDKARAEAATPASLHA